MRHPFLIATTTLFCCTRLLADTRASAPSSQPAPPLQLSLVALPEKNADHRALYKLQITNVSTNLVRLDNRLLNTTYMVHLFDSENKPIGNYMPSPFREFEAKDIYVLNPQKTFEMTFTAEECTPLKFDHPPYDMKCCFDAAHLHYPDAAGMYTRPVCSNVLKFGQPRPAPETTKSPAPVTK